MKQTLKRTIIMALALTLAVTTVIVSAEPVSAASKSKSGKVYDDVIVSGNYAYCAAGEALVKVNLKTKKVKTLYKDKYIDVEIAKMVKSGKNLYFLVAGSGLPSFYRVNTDTKKLKNYKIYTEKYVLSKGKIYFKNMDPDTWKGTNMVMKENGKGKKKTSTAAKMKVLSTNKKGYKIVTKSEDAGLEEDYMWLTKYYLKKPDSKKLIFLREVKE